MLTTSILDFVAQIRAAETPEMVLAQVERTLDGYGVDAFAFNRIPKPGLCFDAVTYGVKAPEDWLKVWSERNYHQIDPGLNIAATSIEPFIYSLKALKTDERSREVLRSAEDFGMHQGMMVPVPGLAGTEGVVWFNGTGIKPFMPILHIIGLYAFSRLRELAEPSSKDTVGLTPREREILSWIANGKSSWEVSEILTISRRTVEWHLSRVMQKLGTVNRTQTVLEALRRGLIAP